MFSLGSPLAKGWEFLQEQLDFNNVILSPDWTLMILYFSLTGL